MSAIKSFSKLRAALAPLGVTIAAAFAPGLAQADAVAQSYLFLNNFRFTTSQPLTVVSASDSGDVSASINGAPASTASTNPPAYTGFALNRAVGPNAGMYVPGSALLGAPPGNYVGSFSRLSAGDPFTTGVQAQVDNTVSLKPGGTGSAQSNAQLGATFTLNAAAPGTVLGVSFDAEGFLRAMLNPFGANPANASAAYNWRIALRSASTGAQVFQWSPDGILGSGITGGTETADAFDLNDNIGLTLAGFDLSTGVRTGRFAAQTFALAAGTYFVDLRHDSSADATLFVPEPGALSLAGLALIGMGVATTRRRKLHSA